MSNAERDRWFKRERCRRRALAQNTPTARHLANAQERHDRRADARPGTIHLGDVR